MKLNAKWTQFKFEARNPKQTPMTQYPNSKNNSLILIFAGLDHFFGVI